MNTLAIKIVGVLAAIALSACSKSSTKPTVTIDAGDSGSEASADAPATTETASGDTATTDTSGADTTVDSSDVATSDATIETSDATADADSGIDAAPDTTATPSFDEAGNCYLNPQTHIEIINACTDATKVAIDTSGLPIADSGL